MFGCNNIFGRMPIAHPRFPCESELMYFIKDRIDYSFYGHYPIETIQIDYTFGRDLFIMREGGVLEGLRPGEASVVNAVTERIKNHLSYRLGEALIRAHKTWWKGGYIKFIFEAKRIKEEFRKNKERRKFV